MTREELKDILKIDESYRIERTVSTSNMDKFQEAICAFANDLPGKRQKGYLLIGVHDDGRVSGLKIDDALMKKISGIRSDGNILPLPVMNTEKVELPEGDVLVVEVTPSLIPPVRYRGRTFIRIGPRRDIASEAEERILIEHRASYMATFDATPCFAAKLEDMDLDVFRNKYLPKAVSPEMLESESRPIEEQLAALGMFDLDNKCPTFAGIVLFGHNPRRFMPGVYVQYVCFEGKDKTSNVLNEREFSDNYCELLPKLESLLEMSVIKQYPVQASMLREDMVKNYPYWAIRELLMNGCMHRDLQSNTPLRFYEFSDHLEITNAGGLYGNARPENFPKINDYRNPIIAGAMKSLGYVNKYNRGIGQVQKELSENGNPKAEFDVNLLTAFAVTVFKGTSRNDTRYQSGTTQKDVGYQSGTSQNGNGYQSGTSREAEHRPFGPNVMTLQERIIEFCSEPKSLREIADFLGAANKKKVKAKFIDNILGTKIVMTVPDKPNSRLQKYVTVKKQA
jgi:ATP-dependent DNA helicase RecG